MRGEVTRSGDLEVEIGGAKPVVVTFRGKANHREPDALLRPLFAGILKKANEPGASIELHFEGLEFFNSSTITSVIQFIRELRDRKVATRVTYQATYKWQKVFFDALRMLERADGLLQISPVSR